ncbi:Uncharacterised protein [uncultured archaeon]|nr:Uncharacterised protein [uncultured archaeon]
MQNVFFLKESVAYADKNVSLVLLNQKQIRDGIVFMANSFLAQEFKSVIVVSYSAPGEEILAKIGEKDRNRTAIIDAFSRNSDDNSAQVIKLSNPSDMTGVQIAIEKSEKNLLGEKIVIFDSINVLTVYEKRETVAKFFHMFNNKIRLEDKTLIITAVKESTDPDLIEYLKEFADKTFDYSSLFISAIAMAQE